MARRHWSAPLGLILAVLCGPVLVRIALLHQLSSSPRAGDISGFLSDVGTSLLFAALLCVAAGRWRRTVLLLGLLCWALLQYGNYEHTRELGAGLQFTFAHYLGDEAFLMGSALSPTGPGLLALLITSTLGMGLLSLWRAARGLDGRIVVAVGLVILGLLSFVPRSGTTPAWRQRHFLHEAVLQRSAAEDEVADTPDPADRPPAFSRQLEGKRRVPVARTGTNVLLILLEGVAGSMIEPIASHHRISGEISMPRLSALADRGWVATNFVLHQRQTNRGVYAVLCGDYPKLTASLAKMTLYPRDPRRDCLPRILARASYQTAYMQAAPLGYMFKEPFARAAGFERVLGNRHFEDPMVRSYWGVDDASFFRRALELVRELDAAERPFFLTLLSVGTHHPPTLPQGYADARGLGPIPASFDYLDLAVSEFVSALEEDGRLDDTLVLVTSDESRGLGGESDLRSQLTQNWGPLIALVPGGAPERIDDLFAHSDLALSVVDYLGLEDEGSELVGRSLFRQSESARRVYFSNVFLRRTGQVDSRGALLFCDLALQDCTTHRVDPSRLLSTAGAAGPAAPEDIAALQAAHRWSTATTTSLGERFEFELAGQDPIPVQTSPAQQLIHGQGLRLPTGSRVDVEIVVEIEGKAPRATPAATPRMGLLFKLTGSDRPLVRKKLRYLRAGDRVTLHCSYAAVDDNDSIMIRLQATSRQPAGLSVRFEQARLKVSPLPPQERPETSVLLEELDVDVERRFK
jgi:hypothetical protein